MAQTQEDDVLPHRNNDNSASVTTPSKSMTEDAKEKVKVQSTPSSQSIKEGGKRGDVLLNNDDGGMEVDTLKTLSTRLSSFSFSTEEVNDPDGIMSNFSSSQSIEKEEDGNGEVNDRGAPSSQASDEKEKNAMNNQSARLSETVKDESIKQDLMFTQNENKEAIIQSSNSSNRADEEKDAQAHSWQESKENDTDGTQETSTCNHVEENCKIAIIQVNSSSEQNEIKEEAALNSQSTSSSPLTKSKEEALTSQSTLSPQLIDRENTEDVQNNSALQPTEDQKKGDFTVNTNSTPSSTPVPNGDGKEVTVGTQSMALNVAYEAMETMRKANLEVELTEHAGERVKIDFNRCTQCLRTSITSLKTPPQPNNTKQPFVMGRQRIPKLLTRSKATPCLICGSPVCNRHSNQDFRKEKISICGECSHLLSLDFVVDCVKITNDEDDHRRKHLNRMIDVYDRVLLMLKYSSQFIHDIAETLEHNTKRNNRVGLGSSATGLVSGITGVVAAATIFTPAGPPLLIASLLFGGSATAASTSSEAINYFSEPNQLANKVIALHAMANSLLRVTGILRDALLRDHIKVDHYVKEGKLKRSDSSNLEKVQDTIDKVQGTLEKDSVRLSLEASSAASKYVGAAGEIVGVARMSTVTEMGAMGARNGRFFSRAGTNVMRTARFARFAGGALSAATIVMEVRDIKNTAQLMRAGNPCEKAETLRVIKDEVDGLPETSALARECENYLAVVKNREVKHIYPSVK